MWDLLAMLAESREQDLRRAARMRLLAQQAKGSRRGWLRRAMDGDLPASAQAAKRA